MLFSFKIWIHLPLCQNRFQFYKRDQMPGYSGISELIQVHWLVKNIHNMYMRGCVYDYVYINV